MSKSEAVVQLVRLGGAREQGNVWKTKRPTKATRVLSH